MDRKLTNGSKEDKQKIIPQIASEEKHNSLEKWKKAVKKKDLLEQEALKQQGAQLEHVAIFGAIL